MSTTTLAPIFAPEPLTSEARAAILERELQAEARHGWRIAANTGTQASLVKGKPTSHLLHVVLSLLTLGLWIPVWIAVAVLAGENTKVLTVDERGNIRTSR